MNDTVEVQSFVAKYDRKDVILYALSIGFSTGDWSYVHENDRDFGVAPAFALTLMFRASEGHPYQRNCSSSVPSIPQFPPPLLRKMGLIPRSLLLDPTQSLEDYPALHAFQSISWNRHLPVPSEQQPEQVYLRPRFLEVRPKEIGTFVSTEIKLHDDLSANKSSLICTLVSTTLILGLDASLVLAYGMKTEPKTVKRDEVALLVDVVETIQENTALLYRIASGDSNRIHVDVSPFGKPILHGLCTLGIVSRVLLQKHKGMELRHLEGRFVKPIFVGDTIRIRVWAIKGDVPDNVSFQVSDASTGEVKVSRGRASLRSRSKL